MRSITSRIARIHTTSLSLLRGALIVQLPRGIPPRLARGWMRETVSRLFATALMSAALLWLSQPALAQFTQYGGKLVGSPVTVEPKQGCRVGRSSDSATSTATATTTSCGATPAVTWRSG
jgi:hypothetical protein